MATQVKPCARAACLPQPRAGAMAPGVEQAAASTDSASAFVRHCKGCVRKVPAANCAATSPHGSQPRPSFQQDHRGLGTVRAPQLLQEQQAGIGHTGVAPSNDGLASLRQPGLAESAQPSGGLQQGMARRHDSHQGFVAHLLEAFPPLQGGALEHQRAPGTLRAQHAPSLGLRDREYTCRSIDQQGDRWPRAGPAARFSTPTAARREGPVAAVTMLRGDHWWLPSRMAAACRAGEGHGHHEEDRADGQPAAPGDEAVSTTDMPVCRHGCYPWWWASTRC